MSASAPQIDLSYLHEIAGNDAEYISEVLGIFLDTMKTGLPKLEQLVNNTEDYAEIQRQAHFLKSSAGIVKIAGVYENLITIDTLAKQKADLSTIRQAFAVIQEKYTAALPVLLESYIQK